MGLILLLILAACFLLWTGVLLILRASGSPTRDGIGRALAQGRPTEPGQLGFEVESWSLETADGVELPGWTCTTGVDGPTVVWLHDWSGSQLGLLSRLSEWGTWCGRIVTIDLRGHGDAPGACSLGLAEADDLLLLLERHVDGPFVLAGEGLGAVLAINATMAGTVEPLGVFALDPFVHGSERFRSAIREAGYHVFPAADLALIMLWLRGRSPIDLKWPPSAPDVPVLARFTGTGEDVFRAHAPNGSVLRIESCVGSSPDDAGRVGGPWW